MIPELPGEKVTDTRLLRNLRETVADLLQYKGSPHRFPGAQPISFATKHLVELLQENYFVSEKADGVRCLMFTTLYQGRPGTYLIDRKNDYYFLDFGLPFQRSFHKDTVLDGELVYESKNGKNQLYFLFFDLMVIGGKNVSDKPYTKRLGYLREQVVKSYLEHCKQFPAYSEKHPFKMIQKRLEYSYNVKTVFTAMKSYHHKTDGVIFTSAVAPYTPGTCPKMLKWKPSDENTIDFRLGRNLELEILENNDLYTSFGTLVLDDEQKETLSSEDLYHRIIECRYDPQWPNYWRFCRFRDDKLTANHISTYNNVMASIRDNVEQHELEDICYQIYEAWKERHPEEKLKPPRD